MKKTAFILAALATAACLLTTGILTGGTGSAGVSGRPHDPQARPKPAPQPRVPAQVHRFAVKTAMAKFLENPVYPEKLVGQFGLAASDADLSTGDVWATVINDGRGPTDRAYAGLYTVTVENTSGVPWTASIKATFDVTILQGLAGININVYRDTTNFTGRNQKISAAGTYVLATAPFTIEPNQKYHAILEISCEPPTDQAVSVKARIHDLKWNIEM